MHSLLNTTNANREYECFVYQSIDVLQNLCCNLETNKKVTTTGKSQVKNTKLFVMLGCCVEPDGNIKVIGQYRTAY